MREEKSLAKSTPEASANNASEKAKRSAVRSLPKRFYERVSVEDNGNGFAIKLDARSVRTPQGTEFIVPTKALADAVACEWQAQSEVIDPSTMPLTKLSNSTLDGVIPNREVVVDDIAKFSGHDAICYRAEQPQGLVARQSEHWDPILDWAHNSLGVRWVCAGGVMPVTQPPETSNAVRTRLNDTSPFQLAALHELTTLAGSALLALAYYDGALTFDRLWQSANLEEDWQIEHWGEDSEAKARRTIRHGDAKAADQLFVLSGRE